MNIAARIHAFAIQFSLTSDVEGHLISQAVVKGRRSQVRYDLVAFLIIKYDDPVVKGNGPS